MTLTGLEAELMAMLEKTRNRLHVVMMARSTVENANAAVAEIDALLAYAKQYGGPNTSATVER